ncbi:MAG: amino acid transporter [Verrucomicrobia bacterium]|nr:MAG: amino acid transporter [Verrucomicrobiota bacterium]PYJ94543.1 MAG: amino acid transporter [Verrucomicrobiota bacterium]PYK34897.1 MAG: amino acid transporter [Verrucomicrobiota bacterium]PYL20851.1 MAG: amino acid transporter [Verrucomicrobiota bacterium]PYL81480.1 MAG: amino acid transporter [Verrucomicrobiota bacterium]
MADLIVTESGAVHRPRNVDWKRAAALLYGDWGTSKAYVIGLAFLAAGFSSLPIILAVCAVTGLVGINYMVICRHFPDGGGVYSAARSQGRALAVVGALLLVADLTVTAALSGWSALSYITSGAEHITSIKLLRDHIALTTIGVLLIMGAINYFGPKHSGTFAVALAIPTALVVITMIAISVPHFTTRFLEPRHESLTTVWVQFVSVILALSGAESIANLTGVMKLDPGSTMEHPSVARESLKAIAPVAIEVVFGTALLGWAMLSLPQVLGKTLHLTARSDIAAVLQQRSEDMLRFIGEQFATATFSAAVGNVFGWIVGIVFFLLLLSAANTAIVAMIGLFYMMARDREMPRQFKRLNRHGVPIYPLIISIGLPAVVLLFVANFTALAGLYAIGVVGAITVNVGSCAANRSVGFTWYDRLLFGITFAILLFVELTLAHTKLDALQFVLAVLIGGLALRAYTLKRQGLTTVMLHRQVAAMVTPELPATMQSRLSDAQKIMVAARGITPVLSFALDEAQLREATLCVLYVKEVAVYYTAGGTRLGRARWQDDPEANAIMSLMLKLGAEREISVVPLYAVSPDAAATIVDLSATMGVDFLLIGATQRTALAKLLRGSVVTSVAQHLPDSIQLLIFG